MGYRSPDIGNVLPFTPLPTRAMQAAYDSMLNVGFSSEAILEAYRYTSKGGTFMLNALAFNDPKRRTPDEYAGITLYNAANGKTDEQIIPILAQTAAPFHIIHREERFAFWASTIYKTTVQPIAIEADIPYDRLDAVLQDYAVDLNPSRLTDIKQGRAQFAKPYLRDRVKTRQLALWAFDITRTLLVEHFASAVTSLRANLRTHRRHSTQRDDTILHLAIQLLGAVILADTGVLGDEIRHAEETLSLSRAT